MYRLLYALPLFIAAILVGCGPNTDDKSRVPKGAVDTSDPSKVMMGGGAAPGAPKGAQAGPGDVNKGK